MSKPTKETLTNYIEHLEMTLLAAKEQLAEIVSEPEVKEWFPPGGDWYIGTDGNEYHSRSTPGSRMYGVEFNAKSTAKEAAKAYKIYHWLYQAWLQEVGCWRPDWTDATQKKFYVWYSYQDARCIVSWGDPLQQGTHGFYFPSENQAYNWIKKVGHLILSLSK